MLDLQSEKCSGSKALLFHFPDILVCDVLSKYFDCHQNHRHNDGQLHGTSSA